MTKPLRPLAKQIADDKHRHSWETVGDSAVMAGAVVQQCRRCSRKRTRLAKEDER